MRKAQLRAGAALQDPGDDAGELVLLQLQPVGEQGFVGDQRHVEFRHLAGLPVPVLIAIDDQALGDHGGGHAQLVQHFQRWRVEGGGAQIHG